jgi:alpha-tubulin suppressor-like RCC1 family protein
MKKQTTIVLVIGVLFVVVPWACNSALAESMNWWDSNWPYRTPITITEKSGNTSTDYQVRVDVPYDSNMQSDFDDLRFVSKDGTTKLSYWLDSFVAGSSAKVWVKVPSIPAGGTETIYMYYGNPGAGSDSHGSGSATIVNGRLRCDSPAGNYNLGAVRTKNYVAAGNICLEIKWWLVIWQVCPTTVDNIHADVYLQADNNSIVMKRWRDHYCDPDPWRHNDDLRAFLYINGSSQGEYYAEFGEPFDTLNYPNGRYKIIRYGTNVLTYYDDTLLGSWTNGFLDNCRLGIDAWGSFDFPPKRVDYDDVFIRKYASPEPVIRLYAKETAKPKPSLQVQGGSIVGWGSQVVGVDLDKDFKAVAAGDWHSLGLKSDGSIVAWGYNGYGECNVPSPNAGFVAVAGGWDHSLGLKSDGSIVAWGADYAGQCNVPPPNTGFVAIAAGDLYSLGLKSDGSIVAWGGHNEHGECNVPSPNTGFVAIAAGACGYHSLGLKQNGSIVAWGYNDYGQCNVPLPNTGFVAIAASWDHSLGLKSDGSIVAWGRNDYGQCDVPSPNTGFVAVSAGDLYSLGLKQDGSIVAWGCNDCGECNVPSPNTGFASIAVGGLHSLGLKQDGSIVAWGWNGFGQCNVPSPNTGFVAIAGGAWYSLGLKQDGSIVAWGDNDYGECNVPLPNTAFVAVAAGWFHSLGLKQDGSIMAWGNNSYGQYDVPSPNTGFVAISAGAFHNLGLKQDGSIVAWGSGSSVPSPNTGFVAIAAGGQDGGYHSLGLKSDGSVVAWGANGDGQCDVPEPNTGFVAVAAGSAHSLGLKSDGSIVAWGNNICGQCDVPLPNTGFVAIEAGLLYSLGLKSDGSIVAWGQNGFGIFNVPSPNTGFVAIAAGGYHSLALTAAKPKLGIVSKERIGRTRFVYDCDVTFTNLYSFAVKNVELQLMQVPDNMTIIEPNVTFGDIEFGSRQSFTSTDTCTFIVDRAKPIDADKIIWRIRCEMVDTGQVIELTVAGVEFASLSGTAGQMGLENLAELAGQWLQPPGIPSADIAPPPSGDGIVNFLDFAVLAENWLK